MKLQAELNTVVSKYNEHKADIVEYGRKLKESGNYKDFDTRFAWDVLRSIMGTRWICEMYDKYNCNDTHIDTLAKRAIKELLN